MAATDVVVVIDGKTVTPFARVGRVRIDDILNDAPNTAALTLVAEPRRQDADPGAFAPHAFDLGGFAIVTSRAGPFSTAFDPGAFATAAGHFLPVAPPPINPGAPIAIYLGAIDPAVQIFGGQITVREQYAELDIPAHVRYDLTCVDWTRRLNTRTVTAEYFTNSVSAIVVDLVARFAPGITARHVQPGLPSIPGMTLTFEDVSGALSRLAQTVGAYWYVDYVADLHFFVGTESGAAPAPLVPGGRFADLKISADLTQVRTRIIVEGAGATAAATVPAADSQIPLSTAIHFNPSGGRAKIGTTIVAYTGTLAGGVKGNTVALLPPAILPVPPIPAVPPVPPVDPIPPPAAPGAPAAALAPTTTAGQVAGGPFTYAVTIEMSDGRRSDIGASSAPVTITPATAPPPTSAALLATPGRGPIAVGVASAYATSFVDASGRQTPATLGGTALTGRAVAAPSGGIPYQLQINGRLKVGSYYYAISYLTARGETLTVQSAVALNVTVDNTAVALLAIPIAADARVVGRRVYRSSANPDLSSQATPVVPWRRVIDIPNNTATQYVDVAADSELATAPLPAFSSATDVGEAATVTLATSSDPRVVGRRLYRADGAGAARLVADVRDNTTTSYNDVVVASGGELAPTVNAITTGAVDLSAIPVGPAGTTRRRVFRAVGGADWRELVAINDNTTAALTDSAPDTALGGAQLPPLGIPGVPGIPGIPEIPGVPGIPVTGLPPPTVAGATTIEIDAPTGIPAAGWILVGEQVIRYTGITAGPRYYLTGIPPSGSGAVTADLPPGTVFATVPALTGVTPASRVTIGDEVQIIIQVDDVAAQSALAAVEGSDGIVEYYIQDRRLSEAGALARGRAELALFKTVETRISYTTHDPNTRSGRTVHVALPAPTNLSGDFLIQRVTIDQVATAAGTYPRRQVDASTTRFSFDDVLARLLLESR
jgi:hypothetical protein